MGNGKKLVVFYTRSGVTRKVADEIKKLLSCDIEEIEDQVDRKGVIGFIKSGAAARKGRSTPIAPPKNDASDYDTVIIGTPVWAGRVSCAVRAYIEANREKFKNVAFFATMGGSGDSGAFADMEALCKKSPVAKLTVLSRKVKNLGYEEELKKFVGAISS